MAIAFTAAGTAGSGTASATPGIPAGTAADDILVCVVAATGNTAFTWSAGWTQIVANNMSGTRRMEVRWKRAVAGETSPTITIPAANVILAQIAGYSGCVTTGSPVDQVSSVTNQTTTTLTYAAITPTVADTELILAGAISNAGTTSGYSGTNPTPSERFDSAANIGSFTAVHLASGAKNDTTSSGSRTSTRTGTTASGSLQFNLLPAVTATAVGADLAAPWTVRQAIAAVDALPWTVRQAVAATSALPWTVRQAIAQTLALPWAVRSATAKDLAAPYGVRSLAGADNELSWAIRTALGADLEIPWGMAGAVRADARLDWTVRQAATGDLGLGWALLDVVAADTDLAWTVLGLARADAGLEWLLRGLADGDLELAWAVFAAPTGSPVGFAIVARPQVAFGVAAHHRVAFEIEGRIVTTMRLSAT